jgi:hypothetical protein
MYVNIPKLVCLKKNVLVNQMTKLVLAKNYNKFILTHGMYRYVNNTSPMSTIPLDNEYCSNILIRTHPFLINLAELQIPFLIRQDANYPIYYEAQIVYLPTDIVDSIKNKNLDIIKIDNEKIFFNLIYFDWNKDGTYKLKV